MKNQSLKDIFEEAYEREFAEFDNSPRHKFSFSHKRKTKKIFKLYSDNQTRPDFVSAKPAKRLPLAFILVIILLALTAVSAAAVALYNGFSQKKYSDHTDFLAIDYESGLETIEYIYEFSYLPDYYEFDTLDTNDATCYTIYQEYNSVKTLTISQTVKREFIGHYDNEYSTYHTVYIDDIPAVYIDSSNETENFGILVWDNGDYILEITGCLTKNELMDLAKSLKIKNGKKYLTK